MQSTAETATYAQEKLAKAITLAQMTEERLTAENKSTSFLETTGPPSHQRRGGLLRNTVGRRRGEAGGHDDDDGRTRDLSLEGCVDV